MSAVDVVIVGAGAAGLGAAKALRRAGKTVTVFEAMSRIGGRAHTEHDTFGMPFDRGCAWLHAADRNPFFPEAEAAGWTMHHHDMGVDHLYFGRTRATAEELAEMAGAAKRGVAPEERGEALGAEAAALSYLPDEDRGIGARGAGTLVDCARKPLALAVEVVLCDLDAAGRGLALDDPVEGDFLDDDGTRGLGETVADGRPLHRLAVDRERSAGPRGHPPAPGRVAVCAVEPIEGVCRGGTAVVAPRNEKKTDEEAAAAGGGVGIHTSIQADEAEPVNHRHNRLVWCTRASRQP